MRDLSLTFDEAPLIDAERAFERLLARGAIRSIPATIEDLRRARVPQDAGESFLRVARVHRELLLPEVEVRIMLHQGAAQQDLFGGWRLKTEPEEVDLRLAACGRPDWIIDATGALGEEDLAVHSTFIHFIVRAVLGDRLE